MALGVSGSVMVALSAFALLAPQATMRAGEGIGGVEVGIRKKPGMQLVATQRTAGDGSFAFKNLPAGSYVITIEMPGAGNPAARSYFESRSNTVRHIAVTLGDKTTFDLPVKDGAFVAARAAHDMNKNIIRNIKARQSVEKPNEISIEISDGQQISGRVLAGAPTEAS